MNSNGLKDLLDVFDVAVHVLVRASVPSLLNLAQRQYIPKLPSHHTCER